MYQIYDSLSGRPRTRERRGPGVGQPHQREREEAERRQVRERQRLGRPVRLQQRSAPHDQQHARCQYGQRCAEREAARREQERMNRARDQARATLEAVVRFDYDESVITAAAERLLRAKLPILRNSPTVRLRFQGHADERGSTEYNLALGSRRAESVRDFLSGFGISADRFTTTSFGEERPAVNRSDEVAWAQNRRVEFVITGGQIVVTEDD